MGVRLLLGLVVLATSPRAQADAQSVVAVEKVIRANIAASIDSHAALDATATSDLKFYPLVDDNASPWFDDKCGKSYCNDVVMLFGTSPTMVNMKVAPYKPVIVVDDTTKVAWFSAELKFTGTLREGERHVFDTKGTWPVRVTGVLVEDKGWKVAAEKFSLTLADRKLVSMDDYLPNWGAIADASEREIAGWFPRQLGAKQSTRAHAVNGTSPTEVGRDKATIARLVKGWDKLALTPRRVDFTSLAGGKVAYIHVTLTMPTKPRTKIVTVGIVAVLEGGGWRWVSLNWSPEVQASDAQH